MKMIDLLENHKSKFGDVIASAFAPGRVNLIGEYTDFNDGLVLPMPLPLGVYIFISKGPSGTLIANSEQFEKETKRFIGDKPNGDWTDYLLGALEVSGLDKTIGLCVSVYSDLPVVASVSSSAAIQVAMLKALREGFNLVISDENIAKLAQKAENEYVGVQCGLMDQMVISVGKQNSALLFDIQSGKTENLEFFDNVNVLTIHSGVSRKLKDNAYTFDCFEHGSPKSCLHCLHRSKLSIHYHYFHRFHQTQIHQSLHHLLSDYPQPRHRSQEKRIFDQSNPVPVHQLYFEPVY